MTPAIKEYRVAELKKNPKNPGSGKRQDEAEIRSLAASLRQRQWMPIIVREPELIVLDGNRRLAAAPLAGIETLFGIPVTQELAPKEINRLIAQLDIRHEAFGNRARGQLWRTIREENGWTNLQLAEELGVSAGLLTKVFGNLDNPEEIQRLVEAGTLGLRDGYYLSRIEDIAERLRIAQELAAGRLKPDGLPAMVRKGRQPGNGQQPVVRACRINCPLPSGVNITVSGEGLSLDELIESLGEAQKEAKKARDQGLDAKTFSAVMRDKAKKGN
jgi:ParB family chromosome partitioning protein